MIRVVILDGEDFGTSIEVPHLTKTLNYECANGCCKTLFHLVVMPGFKPTTVYAMLEENATPQVVLQRLVVLTLFGAALFEQELPETLCTYENVTKMFKELVEEPRQEGDSVH